MNKKRWISALLSFCIILSAIFPSRTMAQESQNVSKANREVKLSLYSNLSDEKFISGLYQDEIFYITVEDACKLAGGQVVEETEQQISFMIGNRVREFVIDLDELHMMEEFYDGVVSVDIPVLVQEGKVYISSIHFLNFIDAVVYFSPDTYPQFTVFKQYDIYDAIGELAATDSGYFFWWDEVDAGEEDLGMKLLNAGGVALVNRESNFFQLLIKAEGIAEEALQDALISIIKNEGQNQFGEEDSQSNIIDFLGGLTGVGSGGFELIAETLIGTADSFMTKVKKITTTTAAADAAAASVVVRVANALESRRLFSNITETQKNLLKETILAHPEDSKTLGDGWENVYEAAKKVDKKVQSEFDANYETACETADKIVDDYLSNVAGIYSSSYGAVDLAWSGAVLLTQNLPFTKDMIEHKTQLYNAYNCSIIQLIAKELFVEAFSDLYYANRLYEDKDEQEELLNRIKYAIILQLKSTLTTREYLIQSGFLEESYAEEMKEINKKTADLLRKVEGCKVLTVDDSKIEYDVDLTWMENVENAEKKVLKYEECYYKNNFYYKKEYNKLGQLETWKSNDWGQGEYTSTKYFYDVNGIRSAWYTYDSMGNLIGEEKYNQNGDPAYELWYEYTMDGRHNYCHYTKWEYDNEGKLVKEYWNYYVNENIIPSWIYYYEYNENGIKTKRHKVNYDISKRGKIDYEVYETYNEKEQVVEERLITTGENAHETITYYRYNDKGNRVEAHYIYNYYKNPEKNYESWHFDEYIYDITENIEQEYSYYCYADSEKKGESWYNYEYEYDVAGNVICCKEYRDGELIYTKNYIYW